MKFFMRYPSRNCSFLPQPYKWLVEEHSVRSTVPFSPTEVLGETSQNVIRYG